MTQALNFCFHELNSVNFVTLVKSFPFKIKQFVQEIAFF